MYARSRRAQADTRTPSDSEAGRTDGAAGLFVGRLCLSRFRNYPYLRLDIPDGAAQVVLTGVNGVGKTNLMEAVSFLAPGKGVRQARFQDVLPVENPTGAWGVSAVLHKGAEEIEIGTDYEVATRGRRSEKRRVRVNGVAGAAQSELGRVCSAVWLTPAMDRLFSGEPAGRRRFLDRLTQAFFENHAASCAAYAQAWRQWGALIRDGKNDERWLSALETTMAKYGALAANARRETVRLLQDALNESKTAFPRASIALSGGLEDDISTLSVDEARDFIKARFVPAREAYARNGVAGGVHTVDLTAFHREKNMPAAGCSTGEQKALLVSILLAHVRTQADVKNALPLVLFDEVAAHLDDGRLAALLDEIRGLKTQVWLTGTDRRSFESLKNTAHYLAVDELLRTAPDWAVAS